MAEHARRGARALSRTADPAQAQSGPRHQALQRRAAARDAGYGALLNARAPGPRPAQPDGPDRLAQGPIQRKKEKKKSLRARLRDKLKEAPNASLTQREHDLMVRDKNFAQREHGLKLQDKSVAPPLPLEGQLQAEIARRNDRRQKQATAIAKEVREGDRPDRPGPLKERGMLPGGGKKEDLTAHHLLPYNFIRDSFATAVEKQDLKSMQNVLAFSGKGSSDSSEAYRALAYQKEFKPKKGKEVLTDKEKAGRRAQADFERQQGVEQFHKNAPPESGKHGLRELFKATTWASHNVFMGPAPEHRADDPKEGLDAQFRKDGSPTKSSVMAKNIHSKGFSGISPVDFTSSLQSARNEADGKAKIKKSGDSTAFGPRSGGTRKYDQFSWTKQGDGKLVQIGGDVVARRRYAKWAGKNDWNKLQQLGYIGKDEAKEMRVSVAARRKKKYDKVLSGKRGDD